MQSACKHRTFVSQQTCDKSLFPKFKTTLSGKDLKWFSNLLKTFHSCRVVASIHENNGTLKRTMIKATHRFGSKTSQQNENKFWIFVSCARPILPQNHSSNRCTNHTAAKNLRCDCRTQGYYTSREAVLSRPTQGRPARSLGSKQEKEKACSN